MSSNVRTVLFWISLILLAILLFLLGPRLDVGRGSALLQILAFLIVAAAVFWLVLGERAFMQGKQASTSRSGIAYDLHRLEPARKLILGGVEIPFDRGPAGHSDGDVLSHAICDALLGAASLGDIGTHFPDTDPKWKGASSLVFLEQARRMLEERRLRIAHLDAVVITERPKLSPYFPAMRERLAKALGIEPAQINLKAKTNEGVDAVGRGEAIAAQAIATLRG